MPNTKNVIAAMLRENTGTHILDSGGAYGRNFERNQSRDFEAEPPVTLSFSFWGEEDNWEMDIRISTYHFLCEKVCLVPNDYQVIWEKFIKLSDEDEHWLSLMQKFPGFFNFYMDMWYHSESGEAPPVSLAYGMYDFNTEAGNTVNTYNHESLLDQVLQYTFWEDTGGCQLVLLQVHGGCDVRGGYSAPQFFRTDEYALLGDCRATILPEGWAEDENGIRILWDTDDGGYHWYYDGCCGLNAGKQLETYEASRNPEDRGKGKIYIDEEGNGYCPLSGYKLVAYFM